MTSAKMLAFFSSQTTCSASSSSTSWEPFAHSPHPGLFLWEAFVSGTGKPASNDNLDIRIADARAGAQALLAAMPSPEHANAIPVGDTSVYSLAGTALLRTGWSTATALLSQPCLVLKTAPPPVIC
ncbi:hypothetical protein M3I54_38335 [Paraburkholderia sp. CNPSo 3274]|uniref:hypothetical protein n=1 Tax=Paraburkholderia sp. CNPSo 3274 TaxID=2940932 RepID=UPI0020B83F12|nr:hypothetical protein [Paraburkholderia sp. CNPSo 3274]MCP3712701.1 hypothetical protein [Paraburkholderia sp. CNPSo 3274]